MSGVSNACMVFDIIRKVEIKCQLNTTEVFTADLIACSTCFGHHYCSGQPIISNGTVATNL